MGVPPGAQHQRDGQAKVWSAKGPRNRRFRLSAHTPIIFYDVQDRLGFGCPGKAVDWLIKKAKHAIDLLAELPSSDSPTCLSQGENARQPHVTRPIHTDIGGQIMHNSMGFFPVILRNDPSLQIVPNREEILGSSSFLPPQSHVVGHPQLNQSIFPGSTETPLDPLWVSQEGGQLNSAHGLIPVPDPGGSSSFALMCGDVQFLDHCSSPIAGMDPTLYDISFYSGVAFPVEAEAHVCALIENQDERGIHTKLPLFPSSYPPS